MTDHILDDLFHSCALSAFLEQAQVEQGWPDCEATRRLAYRLYEEALRVKNARIDDRSEVVSVLDKKAAP